jgi:hypothetical protein
MKRYINRLAELKNTTVTPDMIPIKDGRDGEGKTSPIQINVRNPEFDHSKYERTTPSQERFNTALLQRLKSGGNYTGEILFNAKFAVPTNACRGARYCIRAPDVAFLKHGLIVEIDGSAHDGNDKRCRRDNSREQ